MFEDLNGYVGWSPAVTTSTSSVSNQASSVVNTDGQVR